MVNYARFSNGYQERIIWDRESSLIQPKTDPTDAGRQHVKLQRLGDVESREVMRIWEAFRVNCEKKTSRVYCALCYKMEEPALKRCGINTVAQFKIAVSRMTRNKANALRREKTKAKLDEWHGMVVN